MPKTVTTDGCTIEYTRRGILRKTSNGRLVMDACASDGEHLEAPTPEGFERRICQQDILEMVADPRFFGHRCKVTVSFKVELEAPIAIALADDESTEIPITHELPVASPDQQNPDPEKQN
jgi:hypothetical protein